MGWRKLLTHSAGGEIVLGNWRALYNEREDSLDIEHSSDGIPYKKIDTTFLGTHNYTEVNAGVLQIEQWPGWDEAVAKDETYILDDVMSWDETSSAAVLVDYLFGTASATMSYEGEAVFESDQIELSAAGRFNSSLLEWVVANLPVGTVVTVEISIFNGLTWSEWATETNGSGISLLPIAGTDLQNYKLKYRVKFRANLSGETPTISSITTTIFSRKHFRVIADGSYKESQHLIDSISGSTTEII